MSNPFVRQVLAAMIALMLLQLVMAVVVLGVRAPLLMKAGVKPGAKLTRRDADRLPDWARAPGDNYNNLFEAPTAFFAVCLTIVVTGHTDAVHAACAWAYVAVRLLHTLVHATINAILPRSVLFALSWIVLGVIIVRAGLALAG